MHTTLLVPMPANKTLVIAAIAANRYVKMAVNAGYNVVAVDAFADRDTRDLTPDWHQFSVHDGQFEAGQLLALMDTLNCLEGFCYGAGFEQQTDLLNQVAKRQPLLGNAAETVKACKDPLQFFEVCQALSIPTPEVSLLPPDVKDGWLVKRVGGSGGTHVQPLRAYLARANSPASCSEMYYQRAVHGRVYSCLFMASATHVHCVGINQQWTSPCRAMPYRLGGVVSQVIFADTLEQNIINYINKLSQYYDLKGLNSLDFICVGDDVWVLEINPRLSASASLYALTHGHLMELHVALCQGRPWAEVMHGFALKSGSHAFEVLYAAQPLTIEHAVEWPSWVSDIPHAGQAIATNQPVITVNAFAASANAACDLLRQRVAIINQQLNTMVKR